MLCDECLRPMREYSAKFVCTTCGYTIRIKTAVNKAPHPRLEARVDRVRFWSHPLEWMARRPGVLLFIWVVLAWLIMLSCVAFLAVLMDPNVWEVLYAW